MKTKCSIHICLATTTSLCVDNTLAPLRVYYLWLFLHMFNKRRGGRQFNFGSGSVQWFWWRCHLFPDLSLRLHSVFVCKQFSRSFIGLCAFSTVAGLCCGLLQPWLPRNLLETAIHRIHPQVIMEHLFLEWTAHVDRFHHLLGVSIERMILIWLEKMEEI
jgi:hypothetical protein